MVLPLSSSVLPQAHFICPVPLTARGSRINAVLRGIPTQTLRVQRSLIVCEAIGDRDVQARAVAAADAPPVAKDAVSPGSDDSFGVFQLNYDIENEDPRMLKNWNKTINVAVTGASGQIANHLLFMLASGSVFGQEQPIALNMLARSDSSIDPLEGIAMELEDSLYPLLRKVRITTDLEKVFKDADWAILVGAAPRKDGMERSELLDKNGSIFAEQGKALDKVAKKDVKIIVVGNPCNTNALIGMSNAPSIPKKNWHALTRLDENRAKSQLAKKAGRFYTSISNVAIWGNHSTTQVPDFVNARIAGRPATEVIADDAWFKDEFTPVVAKRGGALIGKAGRSSAASTAVSIADAIKSLITPTPPGDCFSTAVCTDGNPYGIAEGLVFSLPCRSKGDGNYEVIPDFKIDDWLQKKIKASEEELLKERNCVGHLIPNATMAVCEITEDTMLPGEN